MDDTRKKELMLTAAKLRKQALLTIQYGGSGHVGGSFSMIEMLTALYFDKLNIRPAQPDWKDRDRFVMSKGHCTPALYSALAMRGYFPLEELKKFRSIKHHMSGHAEMRHVPGVDMSTGSLGQGVSAAFGMALAGKMFNKAYRVYSILGDGEIQEGQVWEAAMASGYRKLDNFTVFVDNNGIQLDGRVEDIMDPAPIAAKFAAFGWNTLEIDGHDIAQIAGAIDAAIACKGKPTAIIAKTVKGKGVSFMENSHLWHGNVPSPEQYEKAFAELDAAIAGLEA